MEDGLRHLSARLERVIAEAWGALPLTALPALLQGCEWRCYSKKLLPLLHRFPDSLRVVGDVSTAGGVVHWAVLVDHLLLPALNGAVGALLAQGFDTLTKLGQYVASSGSVDLERLARFTGRESARHLLRDAGLTVTDGKDGLISVQPPTARSTKWKVATQLSMASIKNRLRELTMKQLDGVALSLLPDLLPEKWTERGLGVEDLVHQFPDTVSVVTRDHKKWVILVRQLLLVVARGNVKTILNKVPTKVLSLSALMAAHPVADLRLVATNAEYRCVEDFLVALGFGVVRGPSDAHTTVHIDEVPPESVPRLNNLPVLAGKEKDPKLGPSVDEKCRPSSRSSSEESGSTQQETATPPPPKEAQALFIPKPNPVAPLVASGVLAEAPVRLVADTVVKDTSVAIITYAQLMRDEGGVAAMVPPAHVPKSSPLPVSQPPTRFDAPAADESKSSVPWPAADGAPAIPAAPRGAVRGFLLQARSSGVLESGVTLADGDAASSFTEAVLLGERVTCGDALARAADPRQTDHAATEVYLNTHEPFCFATVGVQGGGKSHTLACVLEACLVPMPEDSIVRLHAPMSALVLHYDQNVTSVCEATGLVSPHPALQRILAERSGESPSAPCLPRDKMVVLVSPSFYRQRKAFYGDYCTVKPLLFRWHTLTADHIKRIMRIQDGDNQLYVAAMLDLLRRYQRDAVVPAFGDFMDRVKQMCSLNGQRGPLEQRKALLESLVAESSLNADIRPEGADLYSSCTPGTLVIADLTDPLLSAEEANGIFQVLTEQYRALPLRGCGKLLALDEAHKFMNGVAGDGLSEAIVAVARLMRHDGMRLAVSTQSPLALAPELLELVTIAILHRFHSRDWFSYLAKKLPLSDRAALELATLQPGHALAFTSRARMLGRTEPAEGGVDGLGINVFPIRVRGRITADRGASRRNAGAIGLEGTRSRN